MNGAEQVARFTAVRRAEKRLDDLEVVVMGMAAQIVKDRDETMVGIERNRLNLETAFENLRIERGQRFNFEQQTFWQRLCWLVRGA